jgi:hypothetical protein
MTFLSCDCCGDLLCRKPEAAIEGQASNVRFYGSTIFALLVLNWAVPQCSKLIENVLLASRFRQV